MFHISKRNPEKYLSNVRKPSLHVLSVNGRIFFGRGAENQIDSRDLFANGADGDDTTTMMRTIVIIFYFVSVVSAVGLKI